MKLSIWPVQPARKLGHALAEASSITAVSERSPLASGKDLLSGNVDLALVPTIEALLQPEAFELVSSVALVGNASPLQVLFVYSALDEIETVAFDPRYKTEALLAQLVLRENYRVEPSFVPLEPTDSLPSSMDAALVDANQETAAGTVRLDLGREWTDLTLRPMVWGMLAARPGELSDQVVSTLQHGAREIPPGEDPQYQFTMDGYAVAGMDEYIQHLFFTGTLTDFPELRFYQVEEEPEQSKE